MSAIAFGGAKIFRSLDLDESAEEIKATPGTFFGGIALNQSAAPLYLKFYDAAVADVVVGTTTPVMTMPIPSQGDTNGAGFILPVPPHGVAFRTGISVAVTTAVADNDSGAPAANDCVVNFFFE